MTGAGQMETEIIDRLAQAPTLDGKFHLLGNIRDVKEVLRLIDIMVVPSLLDGRPLIVLEALAAGIPVMASAVGGIPELITPGITGELLRPGDYGGFADAVSSLAANPDKLAEMKINARNFAEQNLDIRQMLYRYTSELCSGSVSANKTL
jgi:glycosyltransferase involved in cell wall biosynthesis